MSTERNIDKDAARYRWLRQRIVVRHEMSMAGSKRPALSVRIGRAFIDSTIRPSRIDGEDSGRLDDAIDGALSAETVNGDSHG